MFILFYNNNLGGKNMIDYKDLLDNHSINRLSFLLNYYHLINLSETELVVVMQMEALIANNQLVTSKSIEKRMNISKETIDTTIKNLVKRQYIVFDNYSSINTIDISNVYLKIIQKLNENNIHSLENKENEEKKNLINIFSKEFQKTLTPFEIETIREWSNSYSDELIIYSLKEAVKLNHLSLRYIEKIIIEQARLLNG